MNDLECSGICKFCQVDFAASCFSGYSDHFYSHPEICNDCYSVASDEAAALACEVDSEKDSCYGY